MIIDGKKVREDKLKDLKARIDALDKKLTLVVVKVGSDEASGVYVKQKERLAKELGVNFISRVLPSDVTESELISVINEYNMDKLVNGIIVQLPLPKHINESRIINSIDVNKDVDGLTILNTGKLFQNMDTLVSCTSRGIIDMLDYYNIKVSGKNAVVIGRSLLVGKPVSMLLNNRNATVTMCHSKTENLSEITRKADIIVIAIGVPNFLTSNMVKEGAVVIDVGINRVNGKLVGDAAFEELKEKCSYITPVPGGVGQMTVYELYENVYKTLKLKNM